MRHEQTSTTEKSFKETIMTQEINSTDIEMASEGELYANPEILHYEESELNLIFSNNILMGKLYNLIKDYHEEVKLDSKLKFKYKAAPERVSADYYGTPGLWYLILWANGCECAAEFTGFDTIIVPSLSRIQKILVEHEFILKKDHK